MKRLENVCFFMANCFGSAAALLLVRIIMYNQSELVVPSISCAIVSVILAYNIAKAKEEEEDRKKIPTRTISKCFKCRTQFLLLCPVPLLKFYIYFVNLLHQINYYLYQSLSIYHFILDLHVLLLDIHFLAYLFLFLNHLLFYGYQRWTYFHLHI